MISARVFPRSPDERRPALDPDMPSSPVEQAAGAVRRPPWAESARFGVVALCRCADLPDFDLLITDTGLSEVAAEDIRSVGVNVIMA